jgi:biotin carboxyl carrier protein
MEATGRDLTRLVGRPLACGVRRSAELEGESEVLSPGVGLYDRPPTVGTYVQAGSFAGYLTVLRRPFHLMVPEGVSGTVTRLQVTRRKERVEFRQVLFQVGRATSEIGPSHPFGDANKVVSAGQGMAAGLFVVRSPTDGIFYRRPSPQSPSYVEEGSVVTRGTVMALVEVMKCFNPIVYPGEPGYPGRARVARIVAGDATEVKHGSILFYVEPIR